MSNNFFPRFNLIFETTLTKDQKWVLMCLLKHDGEHGSFPSQSTIATETSMCRTQVQTALRWLEQKRVITVRRKHMQSNVYDINVDTLAMFLPCSPDEPNLIAGRARPDRRTSITGSPDEHKPLLNPSVKRSPTPKAGVDKIEGGGKNGSANPFSDYIKNHDVSEIVREAELRGLSELTVHMAPTLHPEIAQTFFTKLMKEIKEETREFPTGHDLIMLANEMGNGVAFGMMTGKAKRANSKDFFLARIHGRQFELNNTTSNSGDHHTRQLELAKRDTRLQPPSHFTDEEKRIWEEFND